MPFKSQIKRGNFNEISLNNLDGWHSVLGLQFENLVLNNRHLIKKYLNLNPADIVYDNPYFQTEIKTRKACQVDYLIETKTKNLYVFEFKFYKDKVTKSIIEEMQKRIAKLDIPPNYTIRPILIHINGVEKALEETDYFSHIIDFNALIKDA